MNRVITWDIETERFFSEIGGRENCNFADLGLACACLFDSETDRYHLYDSSMIDALIEHLNCADLLVGFNTLGFDAPVLEGISGRAIQPPQYDILAEVWRALEIAPPEMHGAWKLRHIAPRTIGLEKEHTALPAPELFRAGRFAELHSYNMADVHLTRELFNYIAENGHVIAPDGSELPLALPPEGCYA